MSRAISASRSLYFAQERVPYSDVNRSVSVTASKRRIQSSSLARLSAGDSDFVYRNAVRAKALGRLVRAEVAYGVRAENFGAVKQAVKDELKSSMVANASEPGVITVDGDFTTGYVYASVPLILDLDDYFDGFTVKAPIANDLHTALHSLHKYLMGRLAN